MAAAATIGSLRSTRCFVCLADAAAGAGLTGSTGAGLPTGDQAGPGRGGGSLVLNYGRQGLHSPEVGVRPRGPRQTVVLAAGG
jgi:hypothetical protein